MKSGEWMTMESITLLLVMFLAIRDVFGTDAFLAKLVPSYPMCYFLCLYTTKCDSFIWDADSRICQLLESTDTSVASTLKYKYQVPATCIATVNTGKLPEGVCMHDTCGEHDTCVPVEAGKAYVCLRMVAFPTTTTTTPTTTTTTTPTATTITTLATAATRPATTNYTVSATTTTTTTTSTPTTTTTSTPTTTTTTTPAATTTTTTSTITTTTTSTTTTTTTTSTTTTTTTPTTTTTTTPTTTTTTTPTTTTTTTPTTSTTTTQTLYNQYEGCYEDDLDRVLPHAMVSTPNLTLSWCMLHCHSNSYSYFGLEVSRQCYCGNVIGEGYTKRDDHECNYACGGDPRTKCGGIWRLSLYRIIISP